MKTLEELNALSKADLKTYGMEIESDVKGNLSEETLVERIKDRQELILKQRAHDENYGVKALEGVPEPVPAEVPETKETKDRSKEIAKLMESFPGIQLEQDAVSWTMSYRNQTVSGNNGLPDNLIVRQAQTLVSR